jgi:hypothetical protein
VQLVAAHVPENVDSVFSQSGLVGFCAQNCVSGSVVVLVPVVVVPSGLFVVVVVVVEQDSPVQVVVPVEPPEPAGTPEAVGAVVGAPVVVVGAGAADEPQGTFTVTPFTVPGQVGGRFGSGAGGVGVAGAGALGPAVHR